MKRLIILSCVMFQLFLGAAWAEKEKIVVHITDKRNALVVNQAIQNLIEYYGDDREIVLVANGPAVELFTRMLGKQTLVEALQMNDVRIGVCSVALERFSIPEDMLFDGVQVFKDTGIVRIIELQKQGYRYVKI